MRGPIGHLSKAHSELPRLRPYQLIHGSLRDVSSAEEALSRLAAISGAGEATVNDLVLKRSRQASSARETLSIAISESVTLARNSNRPEFVSWKEEMLVARSLGDEDCTNTIHDLSREAEEKLSVTKLATKASEKTAQLTKEKLATFTMLIK